LAVSGKEVRDAEDLVRAIGSRKPGDVVTLKVRRGDEELELKATLGKRPAGGLSRGLFQNSLGMKLVLIPKGTFNMGSPKGEEVRAPFDEDAHEVAITRPFYLGKYEVTKGEFAAFVRATGYKTEAEKDDKGGWGRDATGQRERKPEYTWRNPGWE